MSGISFLLGILSTLVGEIVACAIYAIIDSRKRGKR